MFSSLEISLADILRVGLSLLATQPKTQPYHTSLKEKQMSVLNIGLPGTNANNAGAKAKAEPKEKSQVWLNVGMNLPMQNPDGTTENVFISLPFGLALDTMTKGEAKGNNKDYAHLVAAKNWLLEQLQTAGNKLEAGQSQTITGLELQMRRVSEGAVVETGDNRYLAAMLPRFAA